jgi:hypothetical protein
MKTPWKWMCLALIATRTGLAAEAEPAGAGVALTGTEMDEFRVKREEVFAFARQPAVTWEGDRVTIAFESKGFCDVTVAIEEADPETVSRLRAAASAGKAIQAPRIIRHLACGVLGPNAPLPFAPNARAQTLVWDGKDDAGAYVDNKRNVAVRVSLGLKPRFERTLFWHPGKSAGGVTAFAPAPEGVYVFRGGRALDHLCLFDRDGNYARTLYPFAAGKLGDISGLIRHRFPDGVELPIKPNWLQSSFLMSGSNCTTPTYQDGRYTGYRHRGTELNGAAGFSLAAAGGIVALVGQRYSRLASDGTSGGRALHGPDVSFKLDQVQEFDTRRGIDESRLENVRPKMSAFSPDGAWIYLTMYNETHPGSFGRVAWQHAVMIKRFDDDTPARIFAGAAEAGKADGQFNIPADVACDSQGRVYVADHLNDRLQVFSPDGKHLRNIPVKRPVQLDVHPRSGEIFVFSWALPEPGRTGFTGTTPTMARKGEAETYFRLARFSALDKAQEVQSWDLAKVTGLRRTRASNVELTAAVDCWSEPVRLWITAPSPVKAREPRGQGILLLTLDDGEWTVKRDLLNETARAIQRVHPAIFNRQRLYVNPANGILYLAEGQHAYGKEFDRILRIDPQTGRTREVELPLGAEDMAFDRDGFAYLLTSGLLMRYDSESWREVPFDYGEERKRHMFSEGRSAPVISGACFQARISRNQGGLHVSSDGRIVIGARYPVNVETRDREAPEADGIEEVYQPTLYPGRRTGMITLVQILDRRGRMLVEDAVPGLHQQIDGTAIDDRGDVYIHSASPRVYGGQRHFNDHAGTLMKFTPGRGRLLADSGTPVPLGQPPDRPPDLAFPRAWVEGAHWMYGGVGWGGHNYSSGCACPNTRFALDYFARSFTPEIDRYNVGVLDSNGNLILRVGQCGNVDEGMPLVPDGGPPSPRSIGGDETALFYAPYVATHTDRRLFIADPGNGRVASVHLGYHTEEWIALSEVAGAGVKPADGGAPPDRSMTLSGIKTER